MSDADVAIGSRIKKYRKAMGLSQQALADRLSVSWQQVQKYERGSNRVTASRLWDISQVLGLPVTKFFCDDVALEGAADTPASGQIVVEVETQGHESPVSQKSARDVVTLYSKLDETERSEAIKFLETSVAKANRKTRSDAKKETV